MWIMIYIFLFAAATKYINVVGIVRCLPLFTLGKLGSPACGRRKAHGQEEFAVERFQQQQRHAALHGQVKARLLCAGAYFAACACCKSMPITGTCAHSLSR